MSRPLRCLTHYFPDEPQGQDDKEAIVTKLEKANCRSVDNFMKQALKGTRQLANKSGVKYSVIKKWSEVIARIARTPVPVTDLPKGSMWRISTGCGALDTALGGGIQPGRVTQIQADENCGKTQFCHTLATIAASRQKHVLYIDTEAVSSGERMVIMLRSRFKQNPRKFLPFIDIVRLFHPYAILDILDSLLIDEEGKKYSLVIIDSVIASFSSHVILWKELGQHKEGFYEINSLFHNFATLKLHRPDLAIVFTHQAVNWFKKPLNNVSDVILEIRKQETDFSNSPIDLVAREVIIKKTGKLTVSPKITKFPVAISDEGFIDRLKQ